MTRIDPRLMSDPAQHILASEPSLSNEQRADIWDDFLTAPHARALSADSLPEIYRHKWSTYFSKPSERVNLNHRRRATSRRQSRR